MAHCKQHLLLASVFGFFLLTPAPAPEASQFGEEALTARAAFLVDAPTGQVLYEREPDVPLPPASTTKILTAIVALESGKLSGLLRATKKATLVPSSKLGLRPGQSISAEHLLYSVLLSSANDASLLLAEGIAGSVARFAEMMTLKARELGAKNSRFVNPHGLTAVGHHSTARDMAIIFSYAMKNPDFRKIVQTKTSSVSLISTAKRARYIPIRNHNRLLWDFEGAIGGKTGYTHAAQKCFVGGAARNGTTLIVSILGSRDLWGDTRRLLEYGFLKYEELKVAVPGPSSLEQRIFPLDKPSSPLFSWQEEQRLLASSGYVLQIASFRERDRAEALQRKVSEAGHPVRVEAAPLNTGEITYRVRLGPYPELTQAQEVARDIENKSGLRAIILPASSPAELTERRS